MAQIKLESLQNKEYFIVNTEESTITRVVLLDNKWRKDWSNNVSNISFAGQKIESLEHLLLVIINSNTPTEWKSEVKRYIELELML